MLKGLEGRQSQQRANNSRAKEGDKGKEVLLKGNWDVSPRKQLRFYHDITTSAVGRWCGIGKEQCPRRELNTAHLIVKGKVATEGRDENKFVL